MDCARLRRHCAFIAIGGAVEKVLPLYVSVLRFGESLGVDEGTIWKGRRDCSDLHVRRAHNPYALDHTHQ